MVEIIYEIKVTRENDAFFAQLLSNLGVIVVKREEISEEALLNKRLNTPIQDLNIGARTFNALYGAHVKTLGHICEKTYREIYQIRNMGVKSMGEIEDVLKENKLSFLSES